jgi:hypothetical protein
MPQQPHTLAETLGYKRSDVVCNPDWEKFPGGRHHVFLFDGTWNDDTGPNPADFTWDPVRHLWQSRNDPQQAYPPIVTNVVKTYHALAADGDTQVTHYFRGIGNDDENDLINAMAEGAGAHAEGSIRNAAYCELLRNYRKGDQLSIFGFSRGAASARLFAAYVRQHGILDDVLIESRSNTNQAAGDTWEEILTVSTFQSKPVVPGDKVPIAFLGVWDTVATAISASDGDWAVPDTVGNVVHCLALDEARKLFAPQLLRYVPAQAANVKEVWFPGCHSDIGGGYFHDALSRLTLAFMWQNWAAALQSQGLEPLIWADLAAQYTDLTDLPFLRHSVAGVTAQIGGTVPRNCVTFDGTKPKVHQIVGKFIQEGGLQYCEEGDGFPPECRISGPVYQPAAYPGDAAVQLYDSTNWPAEPPTAV